MIVFTSFYDFRGHAAYTQSMVALAMELERRGVKWDYWPAQGDFHIERCVNEAYTRFLDDPEATDILNIDSDESFDPAGVLRILSREEEVVGALYKMKNNWGQWVGTWEVHPENGHPIAAHIDPVNKTALIKAHRLPWGMLRVKRSALEKYVAKFPELWYFDEFSQKKNYIFCQMKYGQNGTNERALFSQDIVFSERLKQCGVDLWIEPDVRIDHWGNTEYTGNLRDHLLALAQSGADDDAIASAISNDPKVQEALKEVRRMGREIELRKAA